MFSVKFAYTWVALHKYTVLNRTRSAREQIKFNEMTNIYKGNKSKVVKLAFIAKLNYVFNIK